MRNLLLDVQFGVRSLLKHPGYSLIALLTLALGIGAASSVFSVFDKALLRPLPYPQPDQLVMLFQTAPKTGEITPVSYPNALDWQAQAHVFAALAPYEFDDFNLTGLDKPEYVHGVYAAATLFQELGVRAWRGRIFDAEDDRPGGRPVAMVSHRFWQRHAGRDAQGPATVTVDGVAYQVAGVLPADFRLPTDLRSDANTDFFLPVGPHAHDKSRKNREFSVLARLRPGISPSAARSALETVAARLAAAYPDANRGRSASLVPLHESLVKGVKDRLALLMAAVDLLLLIACFNVANLLLARAVGREREMSIRAALGSSRWQMLRLLLVEHLILALGAGAFGALLALGATRYMDRVSVGQLPWMHDLTIDGRVLAFTLGVSLLSVLLVAPAPLLRAFSSDLRGALNEGGARQGAARRERYMRDGLVVTEVALAVLLLAGTGLMIRSFLRLERIDPGFDPRHKLSVHLVLPDRKYSADEKILAFHRELLRRMQELPGATGAATVSILPLAGDSSCEGFVIAGRPPAAPGEKPCAEYRVVSSQYFKVMGIRLVRGRPFSDQDAESSEPVMVLNQAMADRYWPGLDPIGARVTTNRVVRKVVGIVGNVRHFGLDVDAAPEIYVPQFQEAVPFMALVVGTSGRPAALTAAVRDQILAIDPNQPDYNIKTMEERLAASLASRRFATLLLSGFSLVALLLAVIGVYSVISFGVTQRTREIGLRMLLGAGRHEIVRMVVRRGMLLSATGVVIGLAAAAVLTRTLQSNLFEVSETDFATFVTVPALLLLCAALACYLPGRRASRLAPGDALR